MEGQESADDHARVPLFEPLEAKLLLSANPLEQTHLCSDPAERHAVSAEDHPGQIKQACSVEGGSQTSTAPAAPADQSGADEPEAPAQDVTGDVSGATAEAGEPAGQAEPLGANEPIGVAQGIYPGRVSWVHDPDATSWDGVSGYWWDDNNTDQAVVDEMMSKAVRWLAGRSTDAAAWEAIFRHFNQSHDGRPVGYAPGEKIAVKINQNTQAFHSDRHNGTNASPQVVRALLRQLVYEAGVNPADITVYDASRAISDAVWDRCHPEFPDVVFVDKYGGDGRIPVEADLGAVVRYSDDSVGEHDLPTVATEATYLINVAGLKRHGFAGVTLIGKNHFGSIREIDTDRWSPSALHSYVQVESRPMGSYNPTVDLMGHEHLGGKTLLYMVDGLYGAMGNTHSQRPTRWATLGDDWSSSLFVSQDPVAIDSVALDFLDAEWGVSDASDNYLHEAATADQVRAWGSYDPEGDGSGLESLGAHEHWNNATDRQYTRDLGSGDGVELIRTDPVFNIAPTAGVSQPADNADFRESLAITIVTDADDIDGNVASVQFFQDGQWLGADGDGSDGWSFTWSGAPRGFHTLTAEAVDDLFAATMSDPVTIIVATSGDANVDGVVGIADLSALADNYGQATGATWSQGDFTGDGTVGIGDFSALADHYGHGSGDGLIEHGQAPIAERPAAAEVIEPAVVVSSAVPTMLWSGPGGSTARVEMTDAQALPQRPAGPEMTSDRPGTANGSLYGLEEYGRRAAGAARDVYQARNAPAIADDLLVLPDGSYLSILTAPI